MNSIATTRRPLRDRPITHLHFVMRLALLLPVLLASQVALAEDWLLKDAQGHSHTLASEKGKWVLVNFWAPWCPPCLEEMPGFSKLQKKYRNLQVIGVAVMYRKRSDVTDVIAKQRIAYPIVFGNEDIASEFGELKGLPASFLYDPSGKRLGRHDGPLTPRQLERIMARESRASDLFTRGN